MRESLIEKKLKKRIELFGGKCLKFVSPGLSGVPDRICIFPGGKIFFVETKATGKNLRPLQEKRRKELQAFGFKVYVIDSEEQINEITREKVTEWVK